jgi:hypothetical protein
VRERIYLFIDGPWDGRRAITDGRPVMEIPSVDEYELEAMLKASVQIVESRMTLLPDPVHRVARYVLAQREWEEDAKVIPFDKKAYLFVGWQT